MLLIFIAAFIGLLVAGPLGFLVGGLVGYAAHVVLRQSILGGLRVVQSELIDSTFAIMGALCKADKVVTPDEINAVEQIMTHASGCRESNANRPGRHSTRVSSRTSTWMQPLTASHESVVAVTPLLQLFLQLQTMAVAADGKIDPAEHAMLVRIAHRLGLNEHDVAQLEALLRAAAAGPSARGAEPSKDRLADAYAALGISPDASPAEIKRAYRKLISQNHPDKLAARGLPESMRAVAEERSRELNTAYDLIKRARKIV